MLLKSSPNHQVGLPLNRIIGELTRESIDPIAFLPPINASTVKTCSFSKAHRTRKKTSKIIKLATVQGSGLVILNFLLEKST